MKLRGPYGQCWFVPLIVTLDGAAAANSYPWRALAAHAGWTPEWTAAGHLRALGACLVAMVAASGASALDAVSPSAPGTQSAEAAAIGSAGVNSKPALSVPPMAPSTGTANAGGRSRLLRVLDRGAAGQPQPAGPGKEARPPNVPIPNSGNPIPPMAASVIAGCPRDLLTRLLAGVAERQDALSALVIEHETLKLCHERQLIVTGIFETEAQLQSLRAPAEPAAANRTPAVAATVPSVMPQLNTVAAKLPAPSTIARKPAKAVPAAPRYGWFSIVGMAGDLRAGVTDGRRVWFVREGRSAPRRCPGRPDRSAPARGANRGCGRWCIALQGQARRRLMTRQPANTRPDTIATTIARPFARFFARAHRRNGVAADIRSSPCCSSCRSSTTTSRTATSGRSCGLVPASGTVEWLLGLANAIGLVLLVAGLLLKPVPGSVTRTPREPRTALTPDRQQKERPTREAPAQSGGNDVAA